MLSGVIVFRNANVLAPPAAIVKAFAESDWLSLPFTGESLYVQIRKVTAYFAMDIID